MSAFYKFAPFVPAALLIATGLVVNVAHAAAPSGAEPQLAVKRLVLAHGIENREPQDAATTFHTKDDRVFAFVEVENPKKAEDKISVTFEPPSGPAHAEIPLKIGDSHRYRTWAFTRQAHDKGAWSVVVKDSQGHVLARQGFAIDD